MVNLADRLPALLAPLQQGQAPEMLDFETLKAVVSFPEYDAGEARYRCDH